MKPYINGEFSQDFSQDSFAEAFADIRRVTLIKDSQQKTSKEQADAPSAPRLASSRKGKKTGHRQQEVGADAGNRQEGAQEDLRGRVSGRG